MVIARHKRKSLSLFLGALILGLALVANSVKAEGELGKIRLWVHGNYIETEVAPFIEEGRTLVPLRLIGEALGIPVNWDNDARQVLMEREGEPVIFTIDETSYRIGEEVFQADVAPVIVNDRTFVPVRVVAETFGQVVDWDNDFRTVVIGEGYEPPAKDLHGFDQAVLKRVVDGDTLEVTMGGTDYKLRMILIDAPESKHPVAERNTTYGVQASEFLEGQLPVGTVLYLQKDVSETDRYGRLLRYVWTEVPSSEPTKEEINRWMVNALLLRQGYAKLSTYPPDVKYVGHFRSLAEAARAENAGLWQYGAFEAMANRDQAREDQNQQSLNQQGGGGGWRDPANPAYLYAEGKFIGNYNSMIFHSPGQQGYKRVAYKNAVFFDTAAEAVAAGFRAAER